MEILRTEAFCDRIINILTQIPEITEHKAQKKNLRQPASGRTISKMGPLGYYHSRQRNLVDFCYSIMNI